MEPTGTPENRSKIANLAKEIINCWEMMKFGASQKNLEKKKWLPRRHLSEEGLRRSERAKQKTYVRFAPRWDKPR